MIFGLASKIFSPAQSFTSLVSKTHFAQPKAYQKRYRSAAECIDWTILGKSIFNRPKPLATATLQRIAKGLQKEIVNNPQPFIVADRVTAVWVAQMNGGFNKTHSKSITKPLTTITSTGSQQQLAIASLASPLSVITTSGSHHALGQFWLSKDDKEGALRCAAFLMTYYGSGKNIHSLNEPMKTVTTKDRLALVTVIIKGEPFLIVDISLRMLQPHELYAAQGFPSNYKIDKGHDGRSFTKAKQVHMCGNSVSPAPMAALAKSNNPWKQQQELKKDRKIAA